MGSVNCRILVRRAGEEKLAPGDPADLDRHLAEEAFLWVDVFTRDPDEMDGVGRRFGFDPAAIEDILDVEQLPKYDIFDDHLFVVLHALVTTGDDDRVDTHEVDCFVRPQLLVTVRHQSVVGLDWLWNAVQSYPHLAGHGAEELFAQLSEVMGRRYLEVLDELERRIDELADRTLDGDQGVLAEIQVLRREGATIRRVLRPQRLVIAGLRNDGQVMLDADALRILADSYDVHNLGVESSVSARGLLTDALDTYRGAAAERQTAAATLLTVYAAIVLPLSLITSWYGMNVRELPASESRWGWLVVTAVMAVIAIASWVVFIRVGIIRRPRLRRDLRLVRGLSTAARAPVRPFAMLWRPSNGGGGSRSSGGSGGAGGGGVGRGAKTGPKPGRRGPEP